MIFAACLYILGLGVLPSPAWAAKGDAFPPSQAFTIEPPPGWSLAPNDGGNPGLVLALKGPQKSSFALVRVNPMSLDNRASVRAFLTGVLSSINVQTKMHFTPASNLETATYANGLTAHFIRASLTGKPRMALAVMRTDGDTLVGALVSAVPDTLLPSILGTLKGPGFPMVGASAGVVSEDGQLSFRLPFAVHARLLTERERRMGYVAAFEGRGAEVTVMKLADDGTPVKDQPEIVKSTVRAAPGVDAQSLSAVGYLATSAGPGLIYVSARVANAAAGGRFLAGYMPWAYWGYSILAKGTAAPELVAELFGTKLSLGPSAVPKLVAASPRLPAVMRMSAFLPWTSTLILIILAAAAAWLWRRNCGH